MQPPRPPLAAVDARSAGNVRRLALFGSVRRATRLQRPLHNLCWQCPPSRPPLAASLPHYGTRETRSRLRQSTSRMNGLFAGGFWARHALLGEIRALRRNLGRDSYVPQIAGRDPDTANVFGQELDAQKPPSVRMSPDNKFIVQISPENEAASESRPTTPRCSDLAQKHCGERAEDTQPTNGPCAAHGGLYATRTPFHASHSAQNAPVNPLNLPSTEAREKLLASRCRRQLPGSDSVQIHVRYLSDTSAFSLLAYLATNET